MDPIEYLEPKIVDSRSFKNIIYLVSKNLSSDVKPFFLKGLSKINKIVLAKAFTKYGWLLAIYHALGKIEGDMLIIYYNKEEPKWTASTLIHEVIHLALDIRRQNSLDIIVDETLAYTASFKSGFQDLYTKGVKQAIGFLSNCICPYDTYELVNIAIPRILAFRLTRHDYTYLVRNATKEPRTLFNTWLETNPGENEIQALSIALKNTGIKARLDLPEIVCREKQVIPSNVEEYSREFEGVDRDFVKMIELLDEAAKNKQKAHEILKPWWKELEEIKDEVEAYLYIYSHAEVDP